MLTPVLATKLYIPRPRAKAVSRSRLVAQLNEGLQRKLTLISAPAGFGKTTLVGEWIAACNRPTAWLSVDENDNDPARFLTYLIAALQTIAPKTGEQLLGSLQSPQPPAPESILTALLNEINAIPNDFILVLDDYQLIETKAIDNSLIFLLEHLPVQMHLVIATREDPQLALARLRVRGQLTELRVTDLRFTLVEATKFLNQAMGLNLSEENVAALENRTEGWIAGLQLAAISMQGHKDTSSFIKSFTGSHRFVLDYLVEEVLQQQPESIQNFLLSTAILNRMCGPLCDALLPGAATSGQTTLEYIEHANLFIIPLDNERRWYRYHHLFADLLRQRLQQSVLSTAANPAKVADLHMRASVWFENNDLDIEAFQHAAVANNIEQAARLIEGKGMPLHFRGAVAPVLNWLKSLPAAVLDSKPSLWVTYASTLLATGQTTQVEQRLQAAENALQNQNTPLDDQSRDLIGRIAGTRATLALSQHQADVILTQSQRALEYLHPNNLPFRTATIWKLGYAYQLQGKRQAAIQSYTEAIAISQASGNVSIGLLASTGLGIVQESQNQLKQAAQTYQQILQQVGDIQIPATTCEAHLGLARIAYEWNDLPLAQQHGQQSRLLAPQLQNTDRLVAAEVFLARLKLAQGDITGAAALLAEASQTARQRNFIYQLPEIVATQIVILLGQNNLSAAMQLTETAEVPLSLARIYLAQGDLAAALALLESVHQQMEAKSWADRQLKVGLLMAIVFRAQGEKSKAQQMLAEALELAEPGGFIRSFVDEGLPMARLLTEAVAQGIRPNYAAKLLAAFETAELKNEPKSTAPAVGAAQILPDLLSQRELEVLQLVAQGLSNREISERLFLALDSVKGHNRNIFSKLQVQRRTEAIARARELGLL